MNERNVSKSIKAILDKFQIELDSSEMTLEDLQFWSQEINFLFNKFIEQVNDRFKEMAQNMKDFNPKDISEENRKDFGGFYS